MSDWIVEIEITYYLDIDFKVKMGKRAARSPKAGPDQKKLTDMKIKKTVSPKKKGKAASSMAPSSASSQPTRPQHSLFLTYLKGCMKSPDDSTASQASQLSKHYNALGADEKKRLIAEFFRAGGKRAGLSSVFGQHVRCEQDHNEREWTGYATVDKMMELCSVLGEKSAHIKSKCSSHLSLSVLQLLSYKR